MRCTLQKISEGMEPGEILPLALEKSMKQNRK